MADLLSDTEIEQALQTGAQPDTLTPDLENPVVSDKVMSGEVNPIKNRLDFLRGKFKSEFGSIDSLLRANDIMWQNLDSEAELQALKDLDTPEAQQLRQGTQTFGDDLPWLDPTLWMGDAIGFAPSMVEAAKEGGITGTAGAAAGAVVGGVVTKTPQGAVAGARAGFSIGYPTGAWRASASLASGSIYKSLRAEGISQGTARNAAVIGGAVSGAIEFLQIKGMSKVAQRSFVESLKTPAGRNTLQNFLKVYYSGLPTEVREQVFQENTQEAVELLAQEVSALVENNPDAMPTLEEIAQTYVQTTVTTARGATVLGAASKGAGGVVGATRQQFLETQFQKSQRQAQVDATLAEKGLSALTTGELSFNEALQGAKKVLTLSRRTFREFQEEKAGLTPEDIETVQQRSTDEIIDDLAGAVEQIQQDSVLLKGGISVEQKVPAPQQDISEEAIADQQTKEGQLDTQDEALIEEATGQEITPDAVQQAAEQLSPEAVGRINKIQTEIKSVDDQLGILERQIIEKVADEKAVKALSNKIDKLYRRRQELDMEQLAIEAGTKTEFTTEGVELRADRFISMRNRAAKEAIRKFEQGQRVGTTETKKAVREVQSRVLDLINQSELEAKDKSKFLNRVKSLQTEAQLEKALPGLKERVADLVEKSERRAAKSRLGRLFKRAKPTVSGKRPQGKMTPFAQRAVQAFKEFVNDNAKAAERYQDLLMRVDEGVELTPFEVVELQAAQTVAFSDPTTAEGLNTIADKVQEIVDSGRAERAEVVAEEQAFFAEAVEKVLADIQGNKPVNLNQEKQNPTVSPLKMFLEFWSAIDTWDGFWNIVTLDAPKSKNAQTLMSVRQAKTAEKRLIREVREEYTKRLTEAGGFPHWGAFLRYLRETSKVENFGTYINTKGQQVELVTSRTNLISRWMQQQDPTLLASLEDGNLYSTEYWQLVNKTLTDEDKAMASAYLDFYRWMYDNVTNPLWNAWYGIDLPYNDFYSPIAREGFQSDAVNLFLGSEAEFRSTVLPRSAKSRTPNKLRIADQGAHSVLERHVVEWVHAAAWRNKLQLTTRTLGDTRVEKAIRFKYGDAVWSAMNGFHTDFIRNRIAHYERWMALLDEFRRRVFVVALGGKVKQAPVQLGSIIGYMQPVTLPDGRTIRVNPVELWNGAHDFFVDPKAFETLSQSDLMKSRGGDFERDMAAASKEGKSIADYVAARLPSAIGRKIPVHQDVVTFTMAPIIIGDRGAIYMGGWSLYKKVLAETGDPKLAMQVFEEVTDTTQQSADIDQLSAIQRGNAFMKATTGFLTSPLQYMRKEVHAVINFAKSDKRPADMQNLVTSLFIFHVGMPLLYQFISSGGNLDDDDIWRIGIFGNLNALPIVGDVLEWAFGRTWNILFDKKKKVYEPRNLLTSSLWNAAKFAPASAKAAVSGELDDYGKAFEYMLTPASYVANFPISNFYDMLKHAVQGAIGEEDADTAVKGSLGWPDSALQKDAIPYGGGSGGVSSSFQELTQWMRGTDSEADLEDTSDDDEDIRSLEDEIERILESEFAEQEPEDDDDAVLFIEDLPSEN